MFQRYALIALASIGGASSASGQPTPSRIEHDAVSTAATVVRAAPRLAKIWPGYWPVDQAFIFYDPTKGALLVSPSGVRPPSFRPLADPRVPDLLRGRVFERPGELAEVQAPFQIDYPLGQGRTAILVRTTTRGGRAAAELAFHEQFHAYQDTAFKGKRWSQFIDPAAISDRAAFSAGADIERRVLAAALRARSARETEELLLQYLALRREREATVPAAVSKVEAGLEVIEGTARYVDRQARAAAFGGSEKALQEALLEQLAVDLGAKSGPYLSTWFRGRSYDVGAAICYFLDHLRPGWRTAVEGGAGLDRLLADAVGYREGPETPALARAARERFGYEQRRQELEPAIHRVSKDEITTDEQFYALAPYRVVFTYLAPKVNGRSAVTLGLSSRSMSQLTPSQMVLPAPEVVSATMPLAALTVRKHPFLRDFSGGAEQLVALLPAAPTIVGSGALAFGEHRLPNLVLRADGYELKVDAPVHVAVHGHSMTITAQLPGPAPGPAPSQKAPELTR